jgi:hypothetical protein
MPKAHKDVAGDNSDDLIALNQALHALEVEHITKRMKVIRKFLRGRDQGNLLSLLGDEKTALTGYHLQTLAHSDYRAVHSAILETLEGGQDLTTLATLAMHSRSQVIRDWAAAEIGQMSPADIASYVDETSND